MPPSTSLLLSSILLTHIQCPPPPYLLQQYLDKLEKRPNLKGQKSMNMAKKCQEIKKNQKKKGQKISRIHEPQGDPMIPPQIKQHIHNIIGTTNEIFASSSPSPSGHQQLPVKIQKSIEVNKMMQI